LAIHINQIFNRSAFDNTGPTFNQGPRQPKEGLPPPPENVTLAMLSSVGLERGDHVIGLD